MKKGELRELYQMMFPEYLDIVTVKELREMLGTTVFQVPALFLFYQGQ